MPANPDFNDRNLSLGLARVSEAAAIACAPLIGRGDEKAADQAAVDAMRTQLNKLDIAGVVVIGEGERDEAPMLFIGEEVGTGNGPGVDIALDPLEGTTLTAKDMPNALAVIAMGPRGSMLHAPDVYMDKLAIGPGFKTGVVTLNMSPSERVAALAVAKGCLSRDITVCVLERHRGCDPADHRWRCGRRDALRGSRTHGHRYVHGLWRCARRGARGGGAEMHGRANLWPSDVPQR
jgi:fructose-1,6-bisphosphatase II / sedoheptulose-1,7-bisphosphatase